MSEQDGKQAATLQRPTTTNPKAWKAYWEAQGQQWRTEPEIDGARQKFLTEQRTIAPDIERGVYPFKDIKLSRADIEWLLTTHDNGLGPIDWNDVKQREREGLDLRGANVGQADLHSLPLARLRGGLSWSEWFQATEEQRKKATLLMDGANIVEAQLNGANLVGAQLNGADLRWAHLGSANLRRVQLNEANLIGAQLEESSLSEALLVRANLREARLAGAALRDIVLVDKQHIGPRLVDAQWGNANLAVVDWSQVIKLGDEHQAQQKRRGQGEKKDNATRLREYNQAVRANRQLAVALQSQGLNEDAARFAYRAQKLQRIVQRRQRKFGQSLFSGFLDLLAGYGYRPGRSVIWYLVMILGFALAYHFLGGLSFYPPDAVIFSIMSFHGRGFFPSLSSETNLHNPLVMLAAVEAIVGLLIEISFIATFTQRFFGK